MKFIAEISANHLGRLHLARELVVAAKEAGADYVKFQTFTPGSISIRTEHPLGTVKAGPWAGRSYYDLYTEAALPYEWHAELFTLARSIGIEPFSTPFDPDAVFFLADQLGAKIMKVSSFDVVNLPLLEAIRSTGRKVLMSDGMGDEHWNRARDVLISTAHHPIGRMHCVSQYPAHPSSYCMEEVKDAHLCWGVSDHTMGSALAVKASMLGANYLEKHLCLKREMGGPDSGFSSEPHEFKAMVDACRRSHDHMPSLWVVKPIEAGQPITRDALKVARPWGGVSPMDLPKIIGRLASTRLEAGCPLPPDAWLSATSVSLGVA